MVDTSTFSQERYDALRCRGQIGLGKPNAKETAKYLIDELEILRRNRLLPYLTMGLETGISFYGGRRTASFNDISLRGYLVCPVKTIPLKSLWLDPVSEKDIETWGTLMIGHKPGSAQASWLWGTFWYPSRPGYIGSVETLTEYELAKLISGDDLYFVDDTQLAPSKVLNAYIQVLERKTEALQKASSSLSGLLHLNYHSNERFSHMSRS